MWARRRFFKDEVRQECVKGIKGNIRSNEAGRESTGKTLEGNRR